MTKQYPAQPDLTIDLDKTYTATLATNQGEIVIDLDASSSPLAVNNFVFLARDGFYDGVIFHRVIPGFMIQGGGFGEDLKRKPTNPPIQNESDNGLKNLRGTLSMARTN
ncbi:MAG: peptidylprolyl isomerase, partial [Acidimicrobiia bacterium]|nr:peptidylprolyl isomerase [Acidimicrobiia bacterium]